MEPGYLTTNCKEVLKTPGIWSVASRNNGKIESRICVCAEGTIVKIENGQDLTKTYNSQDSDWSSTIWCLETPFNFLKLHR